VDLRYEFGSEFANLLNAGTRNVARTEPNRLAC
jgi:hypothetical protein